MDKLPIELIQRIFTLLDYRPLASAAKVCRSWRRLSDQEELWKSLYKKRWGSTKAAKVGLDISASQSWKSAYEIQDRWDRVGEEMTIVREGNDYFLAQKGLLLRFLGSRSSKTKDVRPKCATPVPRQDTNPRKRATNCSESGVRSSAPGLLDKLIHFVADMDYEHRRLSKRAHVLDQP
ncbi:hypothetical protein MPTK1_3g00550 [Marchantia polymorpha subsp. ruderalis]|uniref:F-box domain-containing protein n=2 Tax=Marchantia polymorpha TaxID=3197 RepID=A0A176WTQ8_MARPO|nr:hypothetical protein AXG93_1154s1160 [Marchantia polymorpha subsp. ruderalis]PTQ47596.1 hypothetical protein MARPO_0007s0051 [Marchantia polymorpha]BBN03908.1 hypothetical protein Mp_3g00550 [Marchantia polymorpha subsp. ruderalis]|eukprot:PTQ47596.1 hypothetical protein MARPO_0007s0051 [Marchantia polymorpha]